MPPAVTEDLIRRIYRETIDPLYGYVSRRCGGDRDLAEDVTQETWLRAVRDWRINGLPVSPIAWLTRVARNQLLNELRARRSISIEAVPPVEILRSVDSGSMSESASATAVVTQALARLPETQSRLLEAFHFDRCRISQLAESMGVSERAVEGRLRRARESLRRELEIVAQTRGEMR